MKEFYLSRNILVKEWDRETYTVKANSYEEALKKFIEANESDFKDIEDEDIIFNENIPIYETSEYLNPDENASVEIHNEKGVLIWDNKNNYGE